METSMESMQTENLLSLDEAVAKVATLEKLLADSNSAKDRYAEWWSKGQSEIERLRTVNVEIVQALNAVTNILMTKEAKV